MSTEEGSSWNIPEIGDVRFVCSEQTIAKLGGRIALCGITTPAELESIYPGLSEVYYSRTIVPDPRTFRVLHSPEEIEPYVICNDGRAYDNPIRPRFYLSDEKHPDPEVEAWRRDPAFHVPGPKFYSTESPVDMLTTTQNTEINMRMGGHLDNRGVTGARFGVNRGPAHRWSMVGTHSIRMLFDLNIIPAPISRDLYNLVAQTPQVLDSLSFICLRQEVGDMYEACSAALLHDASRWRFGDPTAMDCLGYSKEVGPTTEPSQAPGDSTIAFKRSQAMSI